MVGADHLVAVRDVGARAEEQRAVVGQALEEEVVVRGHHLDVLRGDLVGDQGHLLEVVGDDHLAVVAPGLARDLAGRQQLQLALDLGHGRPREVLGGRQQDRGRGRPVLGLAEQVGRAQLGIDGLVGDHQGLGRPGEQVDADAAEQLALGLGDIGVARPDQHVDGRDARGAERHGADRLDAAETIDLVGAGEVLGGDDRRGRPCRDRAAHEVTMRGTPATLAVTTDMCAEATMGYLPPGT